MSLKLSKFAMLTSVLTGVAYGMILRWLAHNSYFATSAVMSLSFVLFVPFAMGFIPVFMVERRSAQSVRTRVFLPWLTVLLGLLGTMLVLWEGIICIVMLAPLALLAGSAGGVIGGLCARPIRSATVRNTTLTLVVALPFLVNPFSQRFLRDLSVRTVATEIDINAPADVVWRNIERVAAIRREELPPSWSRRIGFPAPEEATLTFEGVGAIRHATFAGGVLFTETVDVWQPNRRLAFSIHANTDQIPNTTLDEHVRIGGPYFDVLHGDYEIETLPNGTTRLHLSSRTRVSTDFNWYAHLWSDAVMRDIQSNILFVIKNRCEKQARPEP